MASAAHVVGDASDAIDIVCSRTFNSASSCQGGDDPSEWDALQVGTWPCRSTHQWTFFDCDVFSIVLEFITGERSVHGRLSVWTWTSGRSPSPPA